jgi:toxin ParE1/3/4
MAYLVSISRRAERDLDRLYDYIDAGESDVAILWYRRLRIAISRLEEHPARCPLTPESDKLRHLLYGRKPHIYRVIYSILEKPQEVVILHIRHGARDAFKPADVT